VVVGYSTLPVPSAERRGICAFLLVGLWDPARLAIRADCGLDSQSREMVQTNAPRIEYVGAPSPAVTGIAGQFPRTGRQCFMRFRVLATSVAATAPGGAEEECRRREFLGWQPVAGL